MIIHGFQKMTLLDYPGKIAATVFTAGCNYRCPFCHNASLVTKIDLLERIDENEVLSFLKKRQGMLDGVCITGGEPLLQNDIKDFIAKIKEMGFFVKLDTNGSFPEKLRDLINSGLLDYVAMDIKNSKEKYLETICTEENFLPKIEESISILLNGNIDYEFRTTVTEQFHEVEDIERIGQWIKGAKKYFIQAFVDSGNLIKGEGLSSPDREKLEKMQKCASKYVFSANLRGI